MHALCLARTSAALRRLVNAPSALLRPLRAVVALVAVVTLNPSGRSAAPTTADGLQPYYAEMNPGRTKVLSPGEIAGELTGLPGWEAKDGMLSKIYAFPTFSDAVAFIVRISHPLEAMDHHPEIRNVYGKVFIGFTTHDQGNKISDLDAKAARVVETIASRLPQKQ